MQTLLLFEVLQPRINDFLDPTQLGAPSGLHAVESLVNGIEPHVDIRPQVAEARVINKDPHKHGDCGNSNRKGDLNSLIGHRSHQNTPSATPIQ